MGKRPSKSRRTSDHYSKYRPVDMRVWNDRRFLSLSDDAKFLWMFLLTCPASLPIPGIILGGDHALAELLGWNVERFAERFRELLQKGMRVRREGRLIWLTNALKYQPPSNPNTVKCWAKFFGDIPEGELKSLIWHELKNACKTWKMFDGLFPQPEAQPYAQRLLELFPERLPEPFHTGTEPEKEKESGKEKETEGGLARAHTHTIPGHPPPTALRAGSFLSDAQNPDPPDPGQPPEPASPTPDLAPTHAADGSGDHAPVVTSPPRREPVIVRDPDSATHRAIVDDWTERYRKKNRAAPTWNPWTHDAVYELLKSHPPEEIHRRMAIAFESPPAWPKHPFDVKTFARSFDLFAQKPDENREKPPPRRRDYVPYRNEVPPPFRLGEEGV